MCFLMIYSTVNHQKLPFSDPNHPPLWWRNTWMVPYQVQDSSLEYFFGDFEVWKTNCTCTASTTNQCASVFIQEHCKRQDLWTIFFIIISVNLECGAETAENTTFISQAAKTTFNSEEQTCTYKICSANPNVARIRFDFTVSA